MHKAARAGERLLRGLAAGEVPTSPAERWGRGSLRLRVETDSPEVDVDVAIYDRAGRRISGLWPRGAFSRGLVGRTERLTLSSLRNGTYRVVVARNEETPKGPVRGRLLVRCRNEKKTLRFDLVGPETAIADVRYRKLR